MRNVNAKLTGSILTLTIDLSQPTSPSSTGKTQSYASSEGNQKVGQFQGKDVIVGVNAYHK